ncbi:hypothetical protein AB0K48_48745 [Nonomuraea sp. NPDC055795]
MTEVLPFGDDPSGYREVPFARNLAVSFPMDTAGFLRSSRRRPRRTRARRRA